MANEFIEGLKAQIKNDTQTSINVSPQFKITKFEDIIEGLLDSDEDVNKTDVIFSGLTDTARRRFALDFTEGYASAKNTVLAKSGAQITNDSKFGVMSGTTMEVSAQDAGVNLTAYDNFDELKSHLDNDDIDAIIFDNNTIKYTVLKNTSNNYVRFDGMDAL